MTAANATPTRSAPHTALALGAILLVGLYLRAAGLDHQSFWIDEIASLQLAENEFLAGLHQIRGDVHPPGYFTLLHWWIQAVGNSESAVRWLSVIPSLLTIAALFRFGRLVYGHRIGLMAAAIAAGSLIQIYYAQEARSYAWLMLLATLSMDATARFAIRGRRVDLIAYAITTTALVYTHYFGFFAVAAQNLFLVCLWWGAPGSKRFPLGGWLLTQSAVALAFLPWLPALVAQTQAVREGFWIGEPSLAQLGTCFLRFASLAGPWTRGGPPGYFAWFSLVVAGAAGTAAVAGGALAIREAQRRRRSQALSAERTHPTGLLIGLWLLLPPLAGWLLSLFGLDVFTYRNTMVSAPAFALSLALLCDKLSGPAWKALAVAAVLTPSLAQVPLYYGQPHKDQWREAADLVERSYRAATDGIAFDAPFVRRPLLHYAPKLREALGSNRGIDLLAATAPEHARIWLVRAYAGPRSRSLERIAGWGYREVKRIELLEIEVVLFRAD